MKTVDRLLARLEDLILAERFEDLESETIEIKPVPATGGEWNEILTHPYYPIRNSSPHA